jgi:hypothetical protein
LPCAERYCSRFSQPSSLPLPCSRKPARCRNQSIACSTRRFINSAPRRLRPLNRFSQSDVLGLNGALMNNGGGGNFHYQWSLQKDLAATLDLALVYLDFSNPFLPFYSSRYRSADVMLVPLFLGLRRDIFRENFDNTVLPYIQFGAGPLAGVAFPYGYGFWESVRRSTTAWTVGGFAGAGLNFALDKKTAGLVDFRYNIMVFPETIGPRHDYSGPAISFGVLRGF